MPLEEELRIVRAYLEIERVRFGDRLRYDVDSATSTASAPAFRAWRCRRWSRTASSTRSRRAAKARIDLRVTAVRYGDRVRIAVDDDGPGFEPTMRPEGHGLGC